MKDEDRSDRAYWLAWSKVPGVGPTLMLRLYRHFGSLAQAWEADARSLAAVEGVGMVTAETAVQFRHTLQPQALLTEHQEHNPFWTPADPEYPRLLLEIPDPPPLLYYRGQVDLRENRGQVEAIALVGTRTPTDYGRRWTRRITQTLVRAGFTIVSGLAEGVDTEVHRACLEADGRTIAVLGTGVNIAYPPTNRNLARQIDQMGLLLSEHPRGTVADRAHFPRRNRIIAGLCRATLVLEAPARSGALITARLANEYGREVYALPGSLDQEHSQGCLELISKGAQVILGEEHLLEALGSLPHLDVIHPAGAPSQRNRAESSAAQQGTGAIAPLTAQLPLLSADLQQVLAVVTGEAVPLDQLVAQSQLSTGAVLSALAQLEMLDLVVQLPGMQYQRR